MNVVYRALLDRLDYDASKDDGPAEARHKLDRQLEVDSWTLPGVDVEWRRRAAPSTAPYWWRGDEDASQTFLAAMGVT